MSQHDMVLDNATGAAFRTDINLALLALIGLSSGAVAPTVFYANQLWADTSLTKLKKRNSANSAWVILGDLDSVNLGMLALAGGSLTGGLNFARGTVAMSATTMDLWSQPNVIDGTGSSVTITNIAAAPQAGATRRLYPVVGTIISNNAVFTVEGATNYTSQAGDCFVFEAVTTTTFHVWLDKTKGSGGNGAIGGGTDRVFLESDMVAQSSYVIGSNGLTSGVTVVAATDLFTLAGHGFLAGQRVFFESTVTLPAPLAADTGYYVIAGGLTANDFKVSLTNGGAAIDITTTGTGVHSVGKLKSASCVGPLTIASGASLTVPSGARLVVL